jgi:hypothetical protein
MFLLAKKEEFPKTIKGPEAAEFCLRSALLSWFNITTRAIGFYAQRSMYQRNWGYRVYNIVSSQSLIFDCATQGDIAP